MENQKQTIKYIAYCRRSSDVEDRQILSIPAQKNELAEIAKRENLKVVETLEESHSAKKPSRPIFNQLLEKFEKGEANGLLVWSANRISRNSIDTGRIVFLMDEGKLLEVKTPSQTFRITPNDKFLLNLFCSQAKLENDAKGEDVKRGLKAKCEKGLYPAPAPTGYVNDKFAPRGSKQIFPDKERFSSVRKMVELMLTGNYNPPQIRKIATDEWGFRMPNGKKMGRNTIYNIFTNSVYYGMFEYPKGSGLWYKGIHEPLMNSEEYDKIQFLLGRKGRPRPKTHVFAFTGMIKCGECMDSMVTAEEKIKKQKNGKVHRYIYYHCSKRKHPNCTQKCIEEKVLEEQIKKAIKEFTIPADLHNFALKWCRIENAKESKTTNAVINTQQKAYKDCINKIYGLIDMRAAKEISEDEFKVRKEQLSAEKKRFEGLFATTNQSVDRWVKKADEVFDFARDALVAFEKGDAMKKKEILSKFGSNLLLKDRMILIDTENTLIPMKEVANQEKRLETVKTGKNEMEIEQIYAQSPEMLRD